MSAIDTAKAVLAKASLFDQTFARPDLAIAVAWAEALGDLDKDDAMAAVTAHYSNEARRIMPTDVKAGVRRIRAKRLEVNFEDIPELDAVADDPIAYKRLLRLYRAKVGSGWTPPTRAITRGERSADVDRLLKNTLAALPKTPEADDSEAVS